ncbi:flagellar hook-length control protein FliK [Citricoccus sp. K5]|uniref:flagellar hook-length control protein FliK n=1 Tax=Citricoccus sp. K5 TaxID=2653135 RepID=UPI0012EF8780|nr:flagellar hook-length control protein FliK [Citricoccus sp. K5]VXB63332.1 conserved hypothetical protein [Citricoccus sp. K5]
MIGSPLNSLIPGPTPDPSRSLSGAGSSSAGSRSGGAGSAGSASAGASGPRFADHLRDASGSTADRTSAGAGEGTDAASVLPPGYTPERTGQEYSRPISLDGLRSTDEAGQGHDAQAGAPAGARIEGSAETSVDATAETVHAVEPESSDADADADASTGVPGPAAGAEVGAMATFTGAGTAAVANGVIVTSTQNASSMVFNPLQNPAHASQPSAVQTGSHVSSSSSSLTGTAAAGLPPVAATIPAATIPAATIPAAAGSPAAVVVPPPSSAGATPTPAVRAWTVQQLSTPVVQAAGRAVSLPNGTHLATVRISPEALGPVTIEAISRDGVVRLEMTAATEAGRENLRAVLGELRRELAGAQAGATLDLSGGSSGHRDANAAGPGTGPSPGGRGGDGKDQEGDGVGNTHGGATVPGADPAEPPTAGTGPDAGPDDGTGGLDVYA